jgi:hypothetical protein
MGAFAAGFEVVVPASEPVSNFELLLTTKREKDLTTTIQTTHVDSNFVPFIFPSSFFFLSIAARVAPLALAAFLL